MSAEEVVSEASKPAADQNAQSAEDAKKLLAELSGGNGGEAIEANGSKDVPAGGDQDESKDLKNEESEKKDRSEGFDRRDRQDGDRRDGGHRGGRGGRGGSRGGRGGYKNYKENIKSDLTTQEVSSDPAAIRKQVEFYFSDSNLPMDKFLFGKVGGSKNNAVELSIIHSFKRMRHFQPFDAIVDALKDSTFLELTDGNTCVRRKEPLPEAVDDEVNPENVKVFENQAMPRSVYVKGFGEEVPSTQFDIEAFFAPYGPTNAIRLRRSDQKLFKGSVFAEFETEELATKFLELDPKPTYKGQDLQIMSKKEYCDKKVDDIKAGKIKPNSEYRGSRGRNDRRDDRRGGRDFSKRKRDDEDNRDWRDRRDEDRKNGFKDGNRRGGRGGRDGRDSRDKGRRDFREQPVERDARGIPTIKTSTEADDKSKKDTGKSDALAKAKAAVEAEQKKESQHAADTVESTEPKGVIDTKSEVAGKKRGREDDGTEVEQAAKKVDVKE